MNTLEPHKDRTNVNIGLVISAPLRDFEAIQDMILQNFPRSYIAYRCWDNGKLRITRILGDPQDRRRTYRQEHRNERTPT